MPLSRLLTEVRMWLGKQHVSRAVLGSCGIRKRSPWTRSRAAENEQEPSPRHRRDRSLLCLCIYAYPKRGRKMSHTPTWDWIVGLPEKAARAGSSAWRDHIDQFRNWPPISGTDFPHWARPNHYQLSPVLLDTLFGCFVTILLLQRMFPHPDILCYLSPYLLLPVLGIRESWFRWKRTLEVCSPTSCSKQD